MYVGAATLSRIGLLLFQQRDLCGVCEKLRSTSGFIIPKSLIYVQTKNMAWKIYNLLSKQAAKHCYVGVYHSDLTTLTKSKIYDEFKSCSSSLRCLVATVAFGMVSNVSSLRYSAGSDGTWKRIIIISNGYDADETSRVKTARVEQYSVPPPPPPPPHTHTHTHTLKMVPFSNPLT